MRLLLGALLYLPAQDDALPADPTEQPTVVNLPTVQVALPVEDQFGFESARYEGIAGDALRREQQPRFLPDALLYSAGAGVQRTGPGQSSPFLHGFTGFRTLYVLDGFRFNHSAWRDGPNQYFGTVDAEAIDSLRIRYGTGGVRYGSDAAGGTIEMETLPAGSPIAGQDHSVLLATRVASAEQSIMGRGAASGRYDSVRYHFGFTTRSMGDLQGGRHTGRQPQTGHNSQAADFKLSFDVGESSEVTVAHQLDRQFRVPRTHRTVDGISYRGTTFGDELHRDLDQDRDMTYLRLLWQECDWFDRIRAGITYHSQRESQDRLRSNFRRDVQDFEVDTLGGYLNFENETPVGQLRYGFDAYLDQVDSSRKDYNVDGSLRSVAIQGPVGDDARAFLGGLFVEDRIPLDDAWTVSLGGRYTTSRVEADRVEDPNTATLIRVDERYEALAGELGVQYAWCDSLESYASLSRAVRIPNLSDLTRFDSARSGEIETPSPGLREERFTTAQVGTRLEDERLQVDAAGFVTWIEDLIVRFPTGNVVQGNDEITKANAGAGRVYGVDLESRLQLCEAWSTRGFGSYVVGYQRSVIAPGVTDREPLSKIPPLRGGLDLRYDHPDSSIWIEGGVVVAARQNRLSQADEADTDRIPLDGTPGYTVVSIRGGFEPMDNLFVSAAVENLTNQDYRLHGSGVNEPGTNAVLSVRWRF